MSAVRVQQQPWIDYLLDTIQKESDPNVQKFAAFFKTVIDDVKSKRTTSEQAVGYIKAISPSIVESSREPYRTQKLVDGIIIFTRKLP